MAEISQKQVKKRIHELRQIRRETDVWQIRTECECVHTRKNDLDVIPVKDPRDKRGFNVVVRCRNCNRILILDKLPRNTKVTVNPNNPDDTKVSIGYHDVIEGIERMCDTIKISLIMDDPKDRKLAKNLSEFMFFALTKLEKAYEKSFDMNRGKNNGGNRRENSIDPAWIRR